jgi:type I restriction enzyme R subunit
VYSLKEGINDGFLTPFKVKQIATTLDEYVYTPDDEVVEGEVEAGQALRREGLQPHHRDQGARGLPRQALHGMIDQREKTIVFCATQAMRWPCAT